MWKNLYTVFNPRTNREFNTLDNEIANTVWQSYDGLYLSKRDVAELPVLGEWINSTPIARYVVVALIREAVIETALAFNDYGVTDGQQYEGEADRYILKLEESKKI
jgi:hypothetical protein